MITEDYVSFEIAKLLKEKGFVGDYTRRYSLIDESDWQGDNRVELSVGDIYSSEIIYIKESIPCPTLQMAMKWLREIHKIHIQVEAIVPEYYKKDEYVYRFHYKRLKHVPIYNNMSYIDDTQYVSCEQACEAAIKYCLENLI